MAVAVYTSLLTLDEAPSGSVTVYDAGTTTSRAIYTDMGLSTAATNPIPLDSAGRHSQGMVYTAATAYKVVVKDSAGVTVYTRDNIDPGVPLGTGKLAIVNGGTGADDAAEALANLGAASSTELADLASDVATLVSAQGSSEKTHIATGTTAQRPASPEQGDIRRNTSTNEYEGYTNVGWANFKTSEDAAATAAVKAQTAEDTYIRPDRLIQSNLVAKKFAYITWSGGTPTLAANFGVSGIVDDGSGQVTLTFNSNMANTSYRVHATAEDLGTGAARNPVISNKAVGSVQIQVRDDAGTASDPSGLSVDIFGELA